MAKHAPTDVRRQQIFDAALTVCAEKGYFNTRVDDIAAQAGLSKGSVYHHFSSKRDLFLDLMATMVEGFKLQMLEVFSSSDSAEQALRRIWQLFTVALDAHPAMLRGMVEFFHMCTRDAVARETMVAYYQSMVDVLAEILKKGQQTNEFSSDFDPRLAAWTYFTAGDGLMLLHVSMDREKQGLEAMNLMTELFLRGLGAAGAPAGDRKGGER